MDPKLKLLAKIDDATQAIAALFAKAKAESRALTDEEMTLVSTHEATADACQSDLEKLEKQDALEAKNAARIQANKAKPVGRKVEQTQPGSEPQIGRIEDQVANDPKKGFKNPREFISAVMQAGQAESYGGAAIDQRLNRLATVGSDEGRVNSDPYGGFLVPFGFTPEMLRVEPEGDPMGMLTRKIPMAQPIVKIPARTDKDHTTSVSGGVTVTRRPETVSGTSSQTTFEQVVLQAHNLFGLSYATEELLTDSPISFAALLEGGFQDQFTYKLINERLFGTGNGEFLGVGNSPALVSVAKETGQASATILYENIIKMRARCWGYQKAIWIANHDCLPQLALMNQAVGSGGFPAFQPGVRLGQNNQDVGDVLLGRPLVFSEYTKTCGTTGDIFLVNWNEYLEGMYQPMESMESVHVRFVNHERTFKFWLRNAGQPWWKTALTVNQGSNTLSPYVSLATR